MLDRTAQQRNWGHITEGEFDALSPADKRAWRDWYLDSISGGQWSRPRREPFTAADLQADYQADHNTHIANGEVRIGRRG